MMWVVALLLAVAVSQILAQDGSDWIAAYDRQVGELAAQHPELRVFDGSSQRGQRREFPCEPLRPSERRAESVHELTPGDIAAVGALGDSVTAGFGARATSLIDLTVEARGASWSIGGDDDVSTLPNFFKVYNADLSGFSTGNGNVGLGYGDASISGAVSPDMLSQAETLASNMESAMGAEAFANEWKLVTVWIGGNDICSRGTSQEEYVAGIEAALDFLQARMPRVFVNLVTIVDVGKLYDITGNDLGCLVVRPTVCSRGADRERSAMEAAAYQRGISELAGLEKYDATDFAVVEQPWYTNFEVINNVDRSFLAPDCFHYAVSAMEFAALATWNNLFQPVGEKQLSYLVGEPTVCPTDEAPYLYTNRNSRRQQEDENGAMTTLPPAPAPAPAPAPTGEGSTAVLLGFGALMAGVGVHHVVTRRLRVTHAKEEYGRPTVRSFWSERRYQRVIAEEVAAARNEGI
jgi:phospholipase B1, membrane-associated